MLAPTEVTVPGDRLVTLSDGRLGWAVPPTVAADIAGSVVVVVGERRTPGTAQVVRSGGAYEEVCGRLRLGAGWRGRWARRPDAVVLVTPTPQAKSPSAR